MYEDFFLRWLVSMVEGGEYHEFRQVFWRGKVAEVSAFWLGTPSPDE